MSIPSVTLRVSGERFRVTFRLSGEEKEAHSRAEDICIEQTIEFPAELVPDGDIRNHVFGRIESFVRRDDHWKAEISFAVEITGFELKQLLNVLFGNISLKPGIRIEQIDFPESFSKSFAGPSFGIDGIRQVAGVQHRPLLCTALKPLGLSAEQLAEQAYQFALGGIDIIKDDHSLADQSFAPFEKRLTHCAQAVRRANRETGFHCLYFPSLTSSPDKIIAHATLARERGAGGLLVAPGLIGFDVLRMLAQDSSVGLPIMSHPAFQGSFVTDPTAGIAHGIIFGQLARLAGADASIFPNYGGRFSFSRQECKEIAEACLVKMPGIRPIFPTPGGGMNLERVPEMKALYGNDVIFLIGGALHQGSDGLVRTSRRFRELVEASVDV